LGRQSLAALLLGPDNATACGTSYVALQETICCYANERMALASGMPSSLLVCNKGTRMSKSASFGVAPSATLFGRFMATVDRLLMASAMIAIRNGEPPYFGL
jgi:hypothetical protein